jgi:hypothetical protein
MFRISTAYDTAPYPSPPIPSPARSHSHPYKSLLACIILSGILLPAAPLLAVQELAQPNDPGLRDPGVPAEVPNISGMWQVRGYDRYIKPMDGSDPPWQPWNKTAFDERAAAEAAGTPLYDPTAACLPSGYPRLIAAPYPVEIVQTPETVVFLYETQHLFRVVNLNGEHPADFAPTHMGHSIGHWEGDTLVVHSTGFVDYTQIDEQGSKHSSAMAVTERIRKLENGSLEILFTIDDPEAFTQPWTARRVWEWRPDVRFYEYVCEENNRNAPDENGVLRNF